MRINKYIYQPETGRNYRLSESAELNIGRAYDNDIVVQDAAVSRHHACVGLKGGKVYVKDMQSTNGTAVNGETIISNFEYELELTDEFRVGTIVFKLLDESSVISRNFAERKMPVDTVLMFAGG